MRKTPTVLLVVVLSGCAAQYWTRVTNINGPDGQPAMLIECSGGPSQCYERAGELCAGKYRPLSATSGVISTPIVTSGPQVVGGQMVAQHAITFRCEK